MRKQFFVKFALIGGVAILVLVILGIVATIVRYFVDDRLLVTALPLYWRVAIVGLLGLIILFLWYTIWLILLKFVLKG